MTSKEQFEKIDLSDIWNALEDIAQERYESHHKDGEYVYPGTGRGTYEQILSGVAGEAAASWYCFGTYEFLDDHVWEEAGDDGWDLYCNGVNIDVKTTRYGYHAGVEPHFLIGAQDHFDKRENKDVYVLISVDVGSEEAKVIGGMPHDEVASRCEWYSQGDAITEINIDELEQANYVAHHRELDPVNSLF